MQGETTDGMWRGKKTREERRGEEKGGSLVGQETKLCEGSARPGLNGDPRRHHRERRDGRHEEGRSCARAFAKILAPTLIVIAYFVLFTRTTSKWRLSHILVVKLKIKNNILSHILIVKLKIKNKMKFHSREFSIMDQHKRRRSLLATLLQIRIGIHFAFQRGEREGRDPFRKGREGGRRGGEWRSLLLSPCTSRQLPVK